MLLWAPIDDLARAPAVGLALHNLPGSMWKSCSCIQLLQLRVYLAQAVDGTRTT